jgi:hypothetical protein
MCPKKLFIIIIHFSSLLLICGHDTREINYAAEAAEEHNRKYIK